MKISDASDNDLAAMIFESEFIQLMCEAGETRVVTVSNSQYIIPNVYVNQQSKIGTWYFHENVTLLIFMIYKLALIAWLQIL